MKDGQIASRMTPLIIYLEAQLTDECTGYFSEIFLSSLFSVSLPTDVTSRRKKKNKQAREEAAKKEALRFERSILAQARRHRRPRRRGKPLVKKARLNENIRIKTGE